MARPSSDGCPTASGLGPSRESTCVGPHRPVGFASDRPRGPRLPLLLLARAAHDDWICFDTRCEVVCRHESRGSALPRRDRCFFFRKHWLRPAVSPTPRGGLGEARRACLPCARALRWVGLSFRGKASIRRLASPLGVRLAGRVLRFLGPSREFKAEMAASERPRGRPRLFFSIGAAVCGGLLPHSGQNTHRLRLSSEAALPKGPRRVALLSLRKGATRRFPSG